MIATEQHHVFVAESHLFDVFLVIRDQKYSKFKFFFFHFVLAKFSNTLGLYQKHLLQSDADTDCRAGSIQYYLFNTKPKTLRM